jgi:hypothetical protein
MGLVHGTAGIQMATAVSRRRLPGRSVAGSLDPIPCVSATGSGGRRV